MLFILFFLINIIKIDIYVCIKNFCYWCNKEKNLKIYRLNDDVLKLEFFILE